jgi:dienelactone hydrolase
MADCRIVVDPMPPPRRVLAVVACALVLASACSSGNDPTDAAPADAGPADTAPAGAAAEGADPAAGPFATGRRTLSLVDAGRGTAEVPGVLPARADRTIEVEVVYPAEGDPAPEPTAAGASRDSVIDAPPADGDFPLVVFAHGFNGEGWFFRGYAEGWARRGYVVALPTFPLSRNGVGVLGDVENQPADISFIIDEMAALPDDDPLAGRVDVERVAVGGHSLGGATVMGVTYHSCCTDDRIDAAIEVAGGPLPFEGGTYDAPPDTPMLLVHGTDDETVPVEIGDAVFEMVAPVWYLRPEGATHSGVFEGEAGEMFDDAVLAFLDATLREDEAGLAAFGDEIEAAGPEWRVRAGD